MLGTLLCQAVTTSGAVSVRATRLVRHLADEHRQPSLRLHSAAPDFTLCATEVVLRAVLPLLRASSGSAEASRANNARALRLCQAVLGQDDVETCAALYASDSLLQPPSATRESAVAPHATFSAVVDRVEALGEPCVQPLLLALCDVMGTWAAAAEHALLLAAVPADDDSHASPIDAGDVPLLRVLLLACTLAVRRWSHRVEAQHALTRLLLAAWEPLGAAAGGAVDSVPLLSLAQRCPEPQRAGFQHCGALLTWADLALPDVPAPASGVAWLRQHSERAQSSAVWRMLLAACATYFPLLPPPLCERLLRRLVAAAAPAAAGELAWPTRAAPVAALAGWVCAFAIRVAGSGRGSSVHAMQSACVPLARVFALCVRQDVHVTGAAGVGGGADHPSVPASLDAALPTLPTSATAPAAAVATPASVDLAALGVCLPFAMDLLADVLAALERSTAAVNAFSVTTAQLFHAVLDLWRTLEGECSRALADPAPPPTAVACLVPLVTGAAQRVVALPDGSERSLLMQGVERLMRVVGSQ